MSSRWSRTPSAQQSACGPWSGGQRSARTPSSPARASYTRRGSGPPSSAQSVSSATPSSSPPSIVAPSSQTSTVSSVRFPCSRPTACRARSAPARSAAISATRYGGTGPRPASSAPPRQFGQRRARRALLRHEEQLLVGEDLDALQQPRVRRRVRGSGRDLGGEAPAVLRVGAVQRLIGHQLTRDQQLRELQRVQQYGLTGADVLRGHATARHRVAGHPVPPGHHLPEARLPHEPSLRKYVGPALWPAYKRRAPPGARGTARNGSQ